MKWRVEYLKAALRDLERLDPYNRRLILKAIQKTAERPLPPPDGIGKPLGNHASAKLSGFYKIKLKSLGYRVGISAGYGGWGYAYHCDFHPRRRCGI